MSMCDPDPESRMDSLFLNYFLLKNNGCQCVMTDAQRVSDTQVLSKIEPEYLQISIHNYIKLPYRNLKEINGFRDHFFQAYQTLC